MFSVKNKVALITGAARGIGLEYAKTLLKHGLKEVSLIDIDEVNGRIALNEIEAEFGENRAIFIKTDVSSKIQFEEAFKLTVKMFRQLDIVINNAGIIEEIDSERCISVNLIGTIIGSTLAMETYLPQFKSGDDAVILNISSMSGITRSEHTPVYCASKYGVIGFSRSIGGPYHHNVYKVRVVTICPHVTDTKILQLTGEQQKEPFLSAWFDVMKDADLQSANQVAEHTVKVIETGHSGSVWIISHNTCHEVVFPTYQH